MRLQLALLVGALLQSSPARGQEAETGEGQATTRVLVYSDDDATSVVTSTVDAEVALPGQLQVGAHALVDVVSSASVDVVSAATERWDETRVEVGARVAGVVADVRLSLGYTRSQENDWLSHSVTVGANKQLFQDNTVLSGFYSVTSNTVGRASDPNFERSLDAHHAELGVSQLVDRKTRVGAAYTLQLLSGYLSSPYRFVVATDGTRVPERHPDSRIRHAWSAWAIRAVGDFMSARVAYRIYADDWGIVSHTASLRWAAELGDRLVVGIEGRGYRQSRAHFFRSTYQTSLRYMSVDRELSPFWDGGGIVDIAATFGPLTADAKVGVIHYELADFPGLRSRNALIAGGGATVTW